MPYPEPERLLDVSMAPPGKPQARGPVTYPLYLLLRDRTSAAFESIGVFDAGRSANLSGDAGGPAVRLDGHRITATGLAAFNAKPLLGRLPALPDEAAAAPTVLLSYPVWQRRFAGRADIVGQAVQIDGQPTVILGVMPEGFGLLDNSSDAFFTFGFEPTPSQQFQHALRAVGRLKPGVSMAEARAAVKFALDEYAQTFPNRDKEWTVELTPWREARFGGLRQPLLMVQFAVGGMLLLLCVNVAVLIGARTRSARQPGAAAFLPVGVAAVLKQSFVLALAGSLGGGLAVWLGLPALRALTPPVLPRLNEVSFGGAVLAFAATLCVTTGLLAGIVPAWRASRADTARPSGRSGWIGASVLVVLLAVQMALAFVLLAGAFLAIRAFGDLRSRDVGINPAGLLSVDVHLPRMPYVSPNVAQVGSIELAEFDPAGPALYDRLRTALQTMPSVTQAAGVGTQPFASAPFVQCFVGEVEHTPDNQVAVQYLAVTENYFNTMGMRIVRGRDFSAADQPDSSWVVLVNETMARQQWPNADPIGQRVTLTFHPNDAEPAREVVGVVADTLPFRGASEVPPLIYLLHRQQARQQRASFESRRTVMSFILRTTGDQRALGEDVRAVVGKVDATTPVTAIRTVESYLNGGQVSLMQYAATLLGLVAGVALVTVAIGVYGFSSYRAANGRTRPVAVSGALVAVGIGAAVGLGAWRRLAGILEPFLTNLTVTPSDPMPLVVACGVLFLTALLACLVPARRATKA